MLRAPWSLPEWKRALGDPEVGGKIRVQAEDFRVWEQPLIEPEGAGSHLWIEVEKRNANTEWVARQFSMAAGIPARDIGFAGMKDRRGVTSQWFSIGLQEAGDLDWEKWDIPGVTILQAHRHGRKLKRGVLSGNRFCIVVRELSGKLHALDARLGRLAEEGAPNYFGPQRFGHDGKNVEHGVLWLKQGGRLPRHKRSIYLSAVRSFLFNEVLSRRVELGNWNHIVDGELAVLNGSRSTFSCSMPDKVLLQRCLEFDIHPSGSLPGRGDTHIRGESESIETEVLDSHQDLISLLGSAGVKAGRRSLRLLPTGLEWERSGSDLTLRFTLPPGGYATSVLRELVSIGPGTISEAG